MFRTRFAALAAASLALLMLSPTVASAAPTQPWDAPPTSSDIALTAAEVNFLANQGVEGPVTAQADDNGAVMYSDPEGDWVISLPSGDGGEISPMWDAGICVGQFYGPTRINDTIEWGGQNSCVTTDPNAVYPHWLNIEFRDACPGGILVGCGTFYLIEETRSNNDRFATVATVSDDSPCLSTADRWTRTYDMYAHVSVNGTIFGPFWSQPVTIDNCYTRLSEGR